MKAEQARRAYRRAALAYATTLDLYRHAIRAQVAVAECAEAMRNATDALDAAVLAYVAARRRESSKK